MKKFLSAMLAITILVTMLPTSVLATEEAMPNVESSAEETTSEMEIATEDITTDDEIPEENTGVSEDIEISENYGKEVSVDSCTYSIEEGNLLYLPSSGRPQTVSRDVTWVIEEGGIVYYSKLDGNNTYIYKMGEDTEITKIFCPVDCFDVYGDDVYYSYDGEVVKVNVKDNSQRVIYKDKNIDVFCYDGELIFDCDNNAADDCDEENAEEIAETPTLAAVTDSMQIRWVGTMEQGNAPVFYSKNQSSYSIPAYTLNKERRWMVPSSVVKITNGSDKLDLKVSSYKSKKTGEVWYYIPSSSDTGIAYSVIVYNNNTNTAMSGKFVRKADFDKAFSSKKSSGVSYSTVGIFTTTGGGNIEGTPYVCYSCSYATIKDSDGDVLDVGMCRKCGRKYNYNGNFISQGGSYTRKPDSSVQTTMKIEPYEDAGNVNGGSGDISEYRIDGYITNAYGSKWYRVSKRKIWSLVDKFGWVHHDKIDKYFDPPKKYETDRVQHNNGYYIGQDSNITISPWNYPTGTINKAKFNLTGKITSSNNLISANAQVINANTEAVALEANEYIGGRKNSLNIEGSNLNYGLKFANLAAGTYYLKYTATDDSYTVSNPWKSANFNVFDPNAPNCPKPSVTASAIEGGQRVSASCSEANALIHIKVNGNEYTAYNTVTADIKTQGNHTVTAWTTNGGAQSGVVTKSVSVLQKNAPVISDAKYTNSYAKVTISGDGEIYYTTNGKNPTKGSTRYTGPIELQSSKTVKAICIGNGYVNSAVSSKQITVKEPEAPQIKLEGEDKVAQGKAIKVSWDKADRAVEYTAYLMKEDTVVQQYTTKDTYVTFVLDEKNDDENIEYTVKVVASNFKGDSDDSNSVTVTAMHPLTVTFTDRIIRDGEITDDVIAQIQQNVDDHNIALGKETKPLEGNVISVQRVDYNSKPGIPAWEDKDGLSRQHFSDEAYQKITEDTVAYAYYAVKSYDVQFWNYWRDYSENNTQIGATQNILYSFSAEPPVEVEAPTGYILAGWNVDGKVSECYDFTFVEGNMKLNTVYTWENKDLPVIIEILSAKRGNTCRSYDVNLKYIHYNEDDTQARIIVTLYTSDNKVVDVAVKDVDLMAKDAGFDYTDTITVDYPDQVSRISAVMVGIKGDMTGGAVSEMAETYDIEMPTADTYWGRLSEWSTTVPDSAPAYNESGFQGVNRVIETKTQYRYRNYKYTESAESTLDGWERYDKKRTSWGSKKGPVYSDPSNGKRKVVSEQYVVSSNYKNVYRYYRIANSQHALWGSAAWDYSYRYNYEFDSPLNIKPGQTYSFYLPCSCSTLTSIGDWYHTVYSVNYVGEAYPASKWVSDNYGTRWYYYNPVYTYYYRKWGSWSSWSDTKVTGDDNATRTVYRYRDEFNVYEGYDPSADSKLEEDTVQTYEISGNIEGLGIDYAGKKATVLVYKKTNTDPTQEQLEYVDQIVLGENNSYSFVVNPKEEIDFAKTGDYIVTLSIAGCDKLVNIDVIEAPRPEYTVNFHSGEQLYTSVTVKDGDSIDISLIDIPQAEGKRFVKWDSSVVNIKRDMDINAVFEPELISVIFVDYENRTTQIDEVYYGDHLPSMPTANAVQGKIFSHWKNVTDESEPSAPAEGEGEITGTDEDLIRKYRVYEAVWTANKYKVEFADFDGNVFETQYVEYGESAQMPEFLEKDGVAYSWDLTGGEWWNVTSDMVVYPYVPQNKDISAPTIDATADEGGGMFYTSLESGSADATVYYSMSMIDEARAREFAKNAILQENVTFADSEIAIMSDSEEEVEETDALGGTIKKYTEPIQINPNTVVYAFAADADGNISQISVFEFGDGIDSSAAAEMEFNDDDESSPLIYLPKVKAKAGETVEVPLSIKNNPGTTALSLIIGYDSESFTDVNVKNGEVFADGFKCDIRDGGSIKLSWESDSENTTDGILAVLEFTAGSEILDKEITVNVNETEVPSFGENPFCTVDGRLEEDSSVLGDVNDDGEVDFSDAILLLKHDVGLVVLGEDKKSSGDVNGDGEVDFSDAILVLKFDVGLISSFKK